jgi:hypothetical protein
VCLTLHVSDACISGVPEGSTPSQLDILSLLHKCRPMRAVRFNPNHMILHAFIYVGSQLSESELVGCWILAARPQEWPEFSQNYCARARTRACTRQCRTSAESGSSRTTAENPAEQPEYGMMACVKPSQSLV